MTASSNRLEPQPVASDGVRLKPQGLTLRKGWSRLLVMGLLVASIGFSVGAQPGSGSRGLPPFDGYRPEGYPAISTPEEMWSMSFIMAGIVAEVAVKENQIVEAGTTLIRLDDEGQRFMVKTRQIRAEDTTELQIAQLQLELAQYDLENVLEMEELGATAPREVERAQTQRDMRVVELRAVKQNRESDRLSYMSDLAFLEDMSIKAPAQAIVIAIESREGEAVNSLEPVIHLVAINPLMMDVAVPVPLGLLIEKGMITKVIWRDIKDAMPVQGRVRWVAKMADARSNTLTVRLEIENPDNLPAGLHAHVQFPEVEPAFQREGH